MTTATSDQVRELLDRVRSSFPGRDLREVPIFGTRAVMVDEAMAVALHRDGSLLVRVDPAEDAQLLKNAGAARAEMGAGRSMGTGWIRVDAEVLDDDAVLASWLGAATRHLDQRARR